MSLIERVFSAYETFFAEREIYVRSQGAVRYITVSSRSQALAAVAGVAVAGWAVFSTISYFTTGGQVASKDDRIVQLSQTYERRLETLGERYNRLEEELDESERRFDQLMADVAGRQGQVKTTVDVENALQGRIKALQRRMDETSRNRKDAERKVIDLRKRMQAMNEEMKEAKRLADQRQASLEDFISTLDSTASERDAARARVRTLTSEVTSLNTRVEDIRKHQAQVMAQLEEAVRESMSEMETVLQRTGVDVDGLLKEIERTYSGEGGPFLPMSYRAPEAAQGFPVSEASVGDILDRLQRVNAMRIAIQRLPLDKPIKAAYRFTSGFGPRRHPITGRWTRHNGIDLAAPRGTPILAPVAGVVTFAGVQRGYGKVVKIRHSLGYETRYAHMHKIRVTKGETVSQGDRIGDVGSTGRSTGNHLHYEIRRYRKPLNPRKFVEAGRNVF